MHRLLQAGHRFRELALKPESVAQVVVRLGIVRLEVYCLPITSHGFFQLPERLQGGPQVAMRLGKVRPCPQGRADVFDGQIMPANLMGDHAEQVQGIDMARLRLQNLPVKLLRLAQVARLMLFHGQVQRWWRIHG